MAPVDGDLTDVTEPSEPDGDALDQAHVSHYIDLQIEEADDLTSVLKSLSKSDPIRKLARRILSQQAVSNADIRPLLQALLRPSEYSWKQQRVAAWSLGRLTLAGDERRAALAMLRQAAAYRRSISCWAAIRRACSESWFVAVAAVGVLYWFHVVDVFPEAFAAFLAVIGTAALSTWCAGRTHRSRVRAAAIHALRRQPDAANVDTLAALTEVSSGIIGRSALDALLPSLATINTEYAGSISSSALQSLAHLAASFGDDRPAMDETARLCVLRALSYVGDATSMSALERLARDRRVRRSTALSHAVQTAISTIAARVERQRGAHTLLRPAVSAVGDDSALLRLLNGSDGEP
ncbi:MAG: hypothetical protein KGJ62_15225 [Armatimonadetes bacterium]|nr:hypothetical protein [Armatimonadota bacterium]MDE2207523.1 hypothetical protein [Armatimonadota bacterium]